MNLLNIQELIPHLIADATVVWIAPSAKLAAKALRVA